MRTDASYTFFFQEKTLHFIFQNRNKNIHYLAFHILENNTKRLPFILLQAILQSSFKKVETTMGSQNFDTRVFFVIMALKYLNSRLLDIKHIGDHFKKWT